MSDGVDLFCGARGWEARAAASLGLDLLGVEWWQPAVATSEAAGLRVRHADVAALNPADFAGHLPETGARILAGSPPCPTFSAAGKGAGRLLTAILVACLRALGEARDERERARREAFEVLQPVAWAAERARAKRAGRDPSREDADAQAKRDADMSVLVVEPLRWALALRPRAVAIEQVPACLPLWQVVAEVLEAVGYSTWRGVLEAERYGVPQTRERAILIARNDGVVAHPPEPTHHRYMPNEPRPEASFDLFGGGLLPWVSMAEALGWHEGDRFLNGTHEHRAEWQADAPAPTLHFGARLNTVVREPWQPSDLVGFPRRADTPSNRAGDGVIEIDGEKYRERDLRTADQPAQHLTEKARSWQRWPGEAPDGQRRNSGPGAERDPRSVDDPSYTIRANGSGSHPSGVEWVHERPAPTFVSTRRSKDGVLIGRQMADGEGENVGGWGYGRPATIVAADPRVFPPGHKVNGDDVRAGRGGQRRSGAGHTDEAGPRNAAVRVTVDEAAALQSFPSGWPWQGTRTAQFTQVGNAVPPLLGEAVLRTLLPAERWRPRPT